MSRGKPILPIESGKSDVKGCFPTESFAVLADRIFSQFHLPILAAASASESTIVQTLSRFAKTLVLSPSGFFSFVVSPILHLPRIELYFK
jgi:hypothetical protein